MAAVTRALAGGPAESFKLVFPSEAAAAFTVLAHGQLIFADVLSRTRLTLSVELEKTRLERAVGQCNAAVYKEAASQIVANGHNTRTHRLSLSRNALWITDVASTATHRIVQYSTDYDRVQGCVCQIAVAACGFDLLAIETALQAGERVASQFMSNGI